MIGSRPDAAANAALADRVRRPVDFAWLDIAGEPVRVTNAPYSVTFAGTGDVDLDGFTFTAVDPRMVDVGAVKAKEGGTDTVTLKLSGLPGLDGDMLDQIEDRSVWQGRDARLWKAMLSPTSMTQLGGLWSYYTGYMSHPKVTGDASSQVILLEVESYLAYFGRASGRSYLDQGLFDPLDNSAALSIAIANGASKRR